MYVERRKQPRVTLGLHYNNLNIYVTFIHCTVWTSLCVFALEMSF